MTLPTNITLPLIQESLNSLEETRNYLKKLVYAATLSMQNSNVVANGSFLQITDALTYPFIVGSITAGTATYSNTTIFVRWVNLMIYAWFDITWSGHTGTGDTLISLPHFSENVPNNPFCCPIEADNMTLTAGYTWLTGNLTPNTDTIGINQNGSGVPLLALPLSANGHLRGSIVYAGQRFR